MSYKKQRDVLVKTKLKKKFEKASKKPYSPLDGKDYRIDVTNNG